MDYQILVNISVGIITLMGGWVFKMILGHINEIKKEHNELMNKHGLDMEKEAQRNMEILEKHNQLALSLPEKYVSKDDFKLFSERMNDRFDRIEEKIDNLKK
tara:strand:- start:4361 stop:4666 length:306 start_codon:yes stop_codon:yes gene_type:complete